MEHSAELSRCLRALDVPAARRLWAHVAPHLPQPATDEEALIVMHAARVEMTDLDALAREYSEAWLAERTRRRDAWGVVIAVIAPARRKTEAREIEAAMSEAVTSAIQAGVDLATEPDEIRRRMMLARERV